MNNISIAFVDTLGLCYDGSTLEKRGLGGSESAVISMSRELAKLGMDVTVFNDCDSDDAKPGVYQGVRYIPLTQIHHHGGYDIFIGSRSVVSFAPDEIKHQFKWAQHLPNLEKVAMSCTHRVLWMHDTFCDGDDLIEDFVLQGRIHEIFTLSDWHTTYVTNCNHGRRRNFEVLKNSVFQTRNGINRYSDYTSVEQKDPDLFVYNASVTKGMIPLLEQVWPRVKQRIPQAKLTVIGGYYRFRSDHEPDEQEKTFHDLVQKTQSQDVTFTGIISQQQIAEILQKASMMIYPAAFPETFGISSLESLAYNTPIITCRFGALEETAVDMACYKIPYAIEPNGLFPDINQSDQVDAFVDLVEYAWSNKYLLQQKQYACNQVSDICTWDTVAVQWKYHFVKLLGQFMPVDEYRSVCDITLKVKKVFGRRYLNVEDNPIRQQEQQHITVIMPVYNAENYVCNSIFSVAAQDYNNYHVYVIDDASTDSTAQVIQDAIQQTKLDHKFTVITREQNCGAVYNQINTITQHCDSDDIVILLDGDDWLVNNPTIFHMYNNLYHDGAQYTYGSCWSLADNIPLIAQPYPPQVKQQKTYRQHLFNWNMPYPHLRTFRASLLDNVDHSVFLDEQGNWFRAGGDNATFYNIIEQADPQAVVCVPDIVMNYNDLNPINDYKVNSHEQNQTASKILKGKHGMKKILIAVPTNKYIEVETFKSIYDLEIPDGYSVDFQYFYGYQIDQIRNLIAHWIVNGYDYLFSVDSDIQFQPDTLKRLLAHDVDVVSGIYRQRLPEQVLEIYDHNIVNIPASQVPHNTLFEIGGCGFGCVLVKRSVFESVGYPYFEYHSALDHADTFSEDVDFCKKAMSKGHKLYCDSSVLCEHKGTHTFTVQLETENPVQQRLSQLARMDLMPKDHVDFLHSVKHINPGVIYDIGSCVMHWTNTAKKVWPNAQYVLFEAMQEVKQLYDQTAHPYHLGVLSDQDGKLVDFYKNLEHPGGNSYYRENPEHSDAADVLYPQHSAESVATRSLDSVITEKNLPWPDLIKLDVQGAELDILRGATQALHHAKHVIVELQHVEYNQKAPSMQQVMQYLNNLGFMNSPEGAFCGSEVDGDYFFEKTITI